jgi:hypothetical protein
LACWLRASLESPPAFEAEWEDIGSDSTAGTSKYLNMIVFFLF